MATAMHSAPHVSRSQTAESTKAKGGLLSPRGLFLRKSSGASPNANPGPMKIEFRVVFRNNGVACDPFATYSASALYAALQYALPAGMSGDLLPSTDSKGQPAVLVRAQASDINSMYDLRSQVVQGDFMSALTRALKANVKSERHSQRAEQSKRTEKGLAPEEPALPAKDEDLDQMDAGAIDMSLYDDENVWEKLRFLWPWQEAADGDDSKATKRELKQTKSQLKERRAQVAELEARVSELTERLAVQSKAPEVSDEIAAVKELKAADAKAARAAPYAREESEQHDAVPPLAFAPAGPVAANHVSLEELTTKQWQMVKALSAVYVANGGELDEYGDITMLRFLLDKDWKLAAAERKAKSTAAWRAKVGANAMRKRVAAGLKYSDIPNIAELFTCVAVANAHSRTRTGDLMTIIDYGSLNVDKFFKAMNNAEYFDINTYILEYLSYHADKLSKETGSLVRQAMVIDAGGIGLSHVSLRMFIRFKSIMPLADLYYPQLLGCARVLNAAWALHQGWKLVKPLLSKEIQDMVGILDAAHSKGALLKIADADAVPDYLCGSCATIPRPARDWYPQDPSKVDLPNICPGKKLGAYMRQTLVPGGNKIAGVADDAPTKVKAK